MTEQIQPGLDYSFKRESGETNLIPEGDSSRVEQTQYLQPQSKLSEQLRKGIRESLVPDTGVNVPEQTKMNSSQEPLDSDLLLRSIKRKSSERRRRRQDETLSQFVTDEYKPDFIPGNANKENLPKRIRETVEHFLKNQEINTPEEGTERYTEEEVLIAASLLEFLSSKPGKIRRTGSTYRNETYDTKVLEAILPRIHAGEPITLFGLSFSPKFRNPDISGGQLQPDMANYLAMSNLQQIAKGANMIYAGGVDLHVGYEGTIYRQLGKYSQEEVAATREEIIALNEQAHRYAYGEEADSINHVQVTDVSELVHSCLMDTPPGYSTESWLRTAAAKRISIARDYEYGHQVALEEIGGPDILSVLDQDGGLFRKLRDTIRGLEEQKQAKIDNDALTPEEEEVINHKIAGLNMYGELESWKRFYLETTAPEMFKTQEEKERYAQRMAVQYKAFNEIKYQGGIHANGILGFVESPVSITVNGTNRKMNIQLVPGWNYYPHHRLTARTIGKNGHYEWTPIRQKEMQDSSAVFLPQYIDGHNYPFYYEQLKPVDNLDQRTSMGAGVQVLQSENGEQFIAKTARYDQGGEHLLTQIAKMQAMAEAGVGIVPEIIDANIKNDRVEYVMPYLDGESLDTNMFAGDPLANTKENLPVLLEKLTNELWTKGNSQEVSDYFSAHHLLAVERAQEAVEHNDNQYLPTNETTLYLNGQTKFNLPILMKMVGDHARDLDKAFSQSVCPEFTHGDLHFGNIFMKDGQVNLIDINGNPNRDVCALEFELSRLILSYYRQIIRDGEYRIETDKQGRDSIVYTQKGQEILAARQEALDLIVNDPHLKPLLGDYSLDNIKLLEAIDIASVFASRPEAQQEGTYLIGTELLGQAIAEREDGMFDTSIFNAIREQITVENYNQPQLNEEIRKLFDLYLADRYDGFSIAHMFNQFVIHAIRKDGRVVTIMSNTDLIDGTDARDTGLKDKAGNALVEVNYRQALEAWQDQNFPENGRDKLFNGFAQAENSIHQAVKSGETLTIGGENYNIKKLLGLGKESKAYEAEDSQGRKIAIKVGLQYLDKEFDYAMHLQEVTGEIGQRFPQYYQYDREHNILSMELIDGQPAEDIVRNLDQPQDWIEVVSNLAGVVKDIATLNEKGVFAGQFNLRNVMVEDSGAYRIIDPLYEGNPDVYEAKQVLRIMGVLVEKIYHTKSDRFPLRVKSSNQNQTLRSLKYPEGALDNLDGAARGIPALLDGELQKVFKCALVNGIGDMTLADVARSFEGINRICEYLQSGETEFNFDVEPRALALDLNGTLEEGGLINAQTVKSINRLLERGTPIAIISGKRQEAICEILEQNGVDVSKIDIVSDEGAVYQAGKERIADHSIDNVDELSSNIEQYLIANDLKAQVRHNRSRINLSFAQFDERIITPLSEWVQNAGLTMTINREIGQIDIVAGGVSKLSGLQEFADRHQLDLDTIVKIGNEPEGNDHQILFNSNGQRLNNAFSVDSSAQTSLLIEQLTDLIGYGGIERTGELATAYGALDDFATATQEELDYLDHTARENSNIFYPYFALKQRFDAKDPKNVNYKWIIRDDDNKPLGFTSLNRISLDGVYNISGMYLTPETRGRGIATQTIEAIKEFAQNRIESFSKFRVRIAESNLPSRRIVEKSGFVPTEVLDDDYTLVINGETTKVKTIVYEYSFSKQLNGIDLNASGVITGDRLKETYMQMKDLQP